MKLDIALVLILIIVNLTFMVIQSNQPSQYHPNYYHSYPYFYIHILTILLIAFMLYQVYMHYKEKQNKNLNKN